MNYFENEYFLQKLFRKCLEMLRKIWQMFCSFGYIVAFSERCRESPTDNSSKLNVKMTNDAGKQFWKALNFEKLEFNDILKIIGRLCC